MSVQLYQGDCLEVMKSIPDNSIDFIFTDPPYGINNNNNGSLIHRREEALGRTKTVQDARPIMNDGKEEATELFITSLYEYKRILKDRSVCCICSGGGGGTKSVVFVDWVRMIVDVLTFHQIIIWDKGKIGMGWRYRRSYETALVAHKGNRMNWYDTSHKVENIIRHIPKIIPSKDQHPTQKPVALARHFIELHTKPGDTVLDPFVGSGTTGVACMQTGRNFIGIELDPNYYKMAEKRINTVPPSLLTVTSDSLA